MFCKSTKFSVLKPESSPVEHNLLTASSETPPIGVTSASVQKALPFFPKQCFLSSSVLYWCRLYSMSFTVTFDLPCSRRCCQSRALIYTPTPSVQSDMRTALFCTLDLHTDILPLNSSDLSCHGNTIIRILCVQWALRAHGISQRGREACHLKHAAGRFPNAAGGLHTHSEFTRD